MKATDTITAQAIIFTKYLVGKRPDAQSIALYSQAVARSTTPNAYDLKLLSFIQKYPFWIGCIDGGLALTNPHSEVRRRIYIMFAILEAQPLFWRNFLPIERSGWYLFFILFASLRAIIRAVTGIVIVKMIGASRK